MKDTIQREFDSRTISYDAFCEYTSQISQVFCAFGKGYINDHISIEMICGEKENTPGHSHYFLPSMACIISTFYSLAITLFEHGNRIATNIPAMEKINPTRKELKNSVDTFLSEIQRVQTEQISKSFLSRQNLSTIHSQMSMLDSQYKAKTIKFSKVRKDLIDLWPQYRSSIEIANKLKATVSKSSRELTGAIDDHAKGIIQAEKLSFEHLVDSFKSLIESVKQLARDLEKNTYRAAKNADTSITFEQYMTPFIHEHKLYMKEFKQPTFERFKFSSRFQGPSEISVPRFRLGVYPVALVRSLSSFEAKGPNEVSIEENEYLFLIEKSQREWAIVMKSEWGRIGYAPREFLEETGSGIGFSRALSSFVSIIDITGDNVMCLTLGGIMHTCPRSDISVL